MRNVGKQIHINRDIRIPGTNTVLEAGDSIRVLKEGQDPYEIHRNFLKISDRMGITTNIKNDDPSSEDFDNFKRSFIREMRTQRLSNGRVLNKFFITMLFFVYDRGYLMDREYKVGTPFYSNVINFLGTKMANSAKEFNIIESSMDLDVIMYQFKQGISETISMIKHEDIVRDISNAFFKKAELQVDTSIESTRAESFDKYNGTLRGIPRF